VWLPSKMAAWPHIVYKHIFGDISAMAGDIEQIFDMQVDNDPYEH